MTASEMAKKANANRRARLGDQGYIEYMRQIAKKPRNKAKKISPLPE